MGKPHKLPTETAPTPHQVEPNDPEDDIEMSFFEHLGELRNRLVRAIWGIVPTVALCAYFSDRILGLLAAPLASALVKHGFEPDLNFTNPVHAFTAHLQVAVVGGLILGSPWIFFQLWLFIAPGLYRSEKRYAVPFVLASAVFFIGGALFAYLVILGPAFDTLLSFAGTLPGNGTDQIRMKPTIMISEHLDLSMRLLLAFGVTFEIPVIITFLALVGVVHWRQLLSFFRWWVVIAAVLSAILTPGGDVGMQLAMLVPLVGLYLGSIVLAWAFGRSPPPETESEPDPEAQS